MSELNTPNVDLHTYVMKDSTVQVKMDEYEVSEYEDGGYEDPEYEDAECEDPEYEDAECEDSEYEDSEFEGPEYEAFVREWTKQRVSELEEDSEQLSLEEDKLKHLRLLLLEQLENLKKEHKYIEELDTIEAEPLPLTIDEINAQPLKLSPLKLQDESYESEEDDTGLEGL